MSSSDIPDGAPGAGVPDGQVSGDGGGILGWLKDVRPTLSSFAKDPQNFIVGVLIVWIINQILGFAGAALGLVLSAMTMVAGIPGMVGDAMGIAGGIIEGSVFGVFGTITEMAVGFVMGLGWTAPLVAALLFVALMEGVETFGPPLATALSDLLGAIPVVGSLLDSGLTFAIELAASFGGDDS